MSLQTKEINYMGVILEVEFEYIPAGGDGFNEPHEPAHCILNDVMVEGVSIIEILVKSQLDRIEEEIQP